MVRPAARPALTKAPALSHPVAPTRSTTTEPEASASRNRQPSGSVALPQSATAPTPLPSASAAVAVEERRVMHSARIPETLRRRVKLHAAEADLTVEEITEAALREYLERNRP